MCHTSLGSTRTVILARWVLHHRVSLKQIRKRHLLRVGHRTESLLRFILDLLRWDTTSQLDPEALEQGQEHKLSFSSPLHWLYH